MSKFTSDSNEESRGGSVSANPLFLRAPFISTPTQKGGVVGQMAKLTYALSRSSSVFFSFMNECGCNLSSDVELNEQVFQLLNRLFSCPANFIITRLTSQKYLVFN